MDTILSILSIYIFILIGFIAKKRLKEQIDDKTLILISIYILQPTLVFWGLSGKTLDSDLLYTPLIYFLILIIAILISVVLSRVFFSDRKNRIVFTISSLISNTGNLGIPLGIVLFGEESIAYTSITNLANLFFMYIFGVFFYSSGNMNFVESIKSILKIPVIWFAILALLFSYFQIDLDDKIDKAIEMGAYSSIVIQLLIFGIYLANVKLKTIDYKLIFLSLNVKFILLPIVAMITLFFIDIPNFVKAIIFLQIALPLAVNNVNLSALYDCKPQSVTALVLFSSILFIGFIFVDIFLLKFLY